MTEETYYSKNKERIRKYQEENSEKIRAYQAEYRARTRASRAQIGPPKKRGRPAGSSISEEELKAKRKIINAQNYAKNKEYHSARNAKWKKNNKEHLAAYKREYFKNNPNARIAQNLRGRLRHALNASGAKKRGSAVTLLCMDIPQFREYIAEKFTEGMSWDNYGEWHLDHIIPLASFDLSDSYQLAQACHYSNYQPLWGVDNSSKGSRLPE